MGTEPAPLLTDAEAAQLLIEIRQVYHRLDRVPAKVPRAEGGGSQPNPVYEAIVIELRGLIDRYQAWEATQPPGEKCRMAKAGLRRRPR